MGLDFSSLSHCRLISNRFHRAVTIKPLLNPFRSINYDERDPFLCNACGFCKYAKFDYTLTARPCCAVDPIENEEDRKKVDFEKNTDYNDAIKKRKRNLFCKKGEALLFHQSIFTQLVYMTDWDVTLSKVETDLNLKKWDL